MALLRMPKNGKQLIHAKYLAFAVILMYMYKLELVVFLIVEQVLMNHWGLKVLNTVLVRVTVS